MRRYVGLAVISVVIASCSVGNGTSPTVLGVSISSTTTLLEATLLEPTTTPTSTSVAGPPGMPDRDAFAAHRDAAEMTDGESFLLEPRKCRLERWLVTLEMGLAWVVTAPRPDGSCDVWLGGDSEEGAGSDVASTYCRFRPDDLAILIIPGRRGPITLDDSRCGPTGFRTTGSQATGTVIP